MTDLSTVPPSRPHLLSRGALPTPGVRHLAPSLGRTLAGAFRAHRMFLLIVALHLAAGLIIATALGRSIALDFGIAVAPFVRSLVVVTLAFSLATLLYVRMVVRPRHPVLYCVTGLKERLVLSPHWGNALPVLLGTAGLIVMTTFVRLMLPELNYFSWDRAFMDFDKALHWGLHPWQITHALAGSPAATAFLDIVYRAGIVWTVLIWIRLAFAAEITALGRRFFLAFALIWILGGALISIGFSAAGPAYYAHLVAGSSPYAPLFQALAHADESFGLWSLGAQQGIWDAFIGTGYGAAGLSAMPSLTCAMLTLATAATFRLGKGLGYASLAVTLASSFAAVHLGWHYAIDCYAGAVLGLAMWSLAGVLSDDLAD